MPADYQRVENDDVNVRVAHLAGSWDTRQKNEAFEKLAVPYVEGDQAAGALVPELRLSGADPDRIVATLIACYGVASNNQERDRVLRLWGIVRPSSLKGQRDLAESIFIPLIGSGKGQTKLALDHFDLVATGIGKSTQTRIKRAFDAAAANETDLQKRVNKVLREAKWIKRSRRFGVL